MDQSPLYAPQGLGRGGGSSGGSSLRGGGVCAPEGEVVGGYVSSSRVRWQCHISIIWRSGGQRGHIILHVFPNQGGVAYSVSVGGVLCCWRCTLFVAEAEAKREVGVNCEEF